MSYFGNNNSPLAFPSYSQANLQQRGISGIAGLQQPQQLGQYSNNQAGQAETAVTVHQQQQQQREQHQPHQLHRPHQQQQQSPQQQPHSHHPPHQHHLQNGPMAASEPPISHNKANQASIKQAHSGIRKERKNRPGQRFGAKKKSWVWSWFIQDSQDPNIAACDYCGKIITRLPSDKGSPKKLSEHLKTHKLTKESINNSRPIPIDGNGVTYAPNGMPLNYPTTFQEGQQATDQQPVTNHIGGVTPNIGESADELDSKKKETFNKFKPKNIPIGNIDSSLTSFGYNSNRRFLSADFDNSPYSPMKFHKHLMKFLTENKLSINVIKSHSFQQLIYDLRSDSVAELLELTGLYSSLLEVSRFDAAGNTSGHESVPEANNSIPTVNESSVVSSLAQAVEQKANDTGALNVVRNSNNTS